LQQRHGDRTLPRPDLDDRIGFPRLDGRHDTADDRRAMQNVLAEPFPWTVTQEVILVLVIINSRLLNLEDPVVIEANSGRISS